MARVLTGQFIFELPEDFDGDLTEAWEEFGQWLVSGSTPFDSDEAGEHLPKDTDIEDEDVLRWREVSNLYKSMEPEKRMAAMSGFDEV